MPPKAPLAPKGGKEKEGKGKSKPKSRKRHKLNLKGWLKTPADWARFNAWAKINAEPRKYPEPEPIIRPAKPLAQMKRRILILSLPHRIQLDPTSICRTDLSVSKAALKAKASKRTRELSKAILRREESCREFPLVISRAALRYKPSQRIIAISQPHVFEPEECKSLEISQNALKHKTSRREEIMSLAKKMIECPGGLTDEEMERLMTPAGVRKSALNYKLTSWMTLLYLPSYRFLKDRHDETAKTWKRQLVEETEERGKRALEEMRKREGREKKGKETEKVQDEGDKKEKGEEESGKEGEDEKDEKEKKEEGDKEKKGEGEKETKEEGEKRKKRREEKNAWRNEPSPCKEDIFSVKRSAIKGTVPPRVEELAKPHVHENKSCRKNPFSVRKSALQAQASPRIVEMAKPSRSLDPIEREPQREKDKYGRPIFPKPTFGKVLPKVKPYKMGDCKDKEEEEKKKKPKSKSKRIDPIAFEPSIDPYFDLEGAKRQIKARQAVKSAKNNKDAKTMEQKEQKENS